MTKIVLLPTDFPKTNFQTKQKQPVRNETKLVKIEEAAQFTGYRVKYIYNLVSQKSIPFVRVRFSLLIFFTTFAIYFLLN